PVQLVFLPDGRKLVVEKAGVVWTISTAGSKLATPFIDLSRKVLSNGDRGLLGVALDPDFASSRWVYFLYTVDPDSDGVDNNADAYSRLERYRTSASDPNVIDASTRQVLIGADWPGGIPCVAHDGSHTIGTIRFGTDGTLFLSSGDAAHFNATDAGGLDASAFGPGRTDPAEDIGAFRAQSINSLDGKILRVDKETGRGLPGNPYWNGDPVAARSRVWAYGMRNPFRFCVRPMSGSSFAAEGLPGQLLVGDVGWSTWEELDVIRQPGVNLGWPCIEGPASTAYASAPQPPGVSCATYGSPVDPASPTGPERWWNHFNAPLSNPPGALANAIVGGTWYSGTHYPSAFRDRWFFSDYVRGWIRAPAGRRRRRGPRAGLHQARRRATRGRGARSRHRRPLVRVHLARRRAPHPLHRGQPRPGRRGEPGSALRAGAARRDVRRHGVHRREPGRAHVR